MAQKDEEGSELVMAARALETELRRFAAHAETAAKSPLRTRKQIERAAKQLETVAASEEALNRHVQALLSAIQQARARKDEQVAAVAASAQKLQERTARYQQLMETYAELGHAAAALNTMDPGATENLHDSLGELAARAEALGASAAADGFDDIAQQAESMREQLLSLRNKVKLLLEKEHPLPS